MMNSKQSPYKQVDTDAHTDTQTVCQTKHVFQVKQLQDQPVNMRLSDWPGSSSKSTGLTLCLLTMNQPPIVLSPTH